MGMACRIQNLETRNKSCEENEETSGSVENGKKWRKEAVSEQTGKSDGTAENNIARNAGRIFEDEPTDLYARSAVLMDADSGRILFGKDADVIRPMASTTKIMTCILALEYLKEHPNQTVEVSDHAASQPKVHLGMQKGEVFYIKDLLYSLMLESHNDSAMAVAEGVAGSVEKFAEKMNTKAAEIGCEDTHFITPNGLDAEDAGGVHSTTAKDLAKIMRYCIMTSTEKETFLEVTRTKEYRFQDTEKKRSFSCHNHNAFLDMMDGALSGKTGFTADAGYCYVGSLRQDERTFIVTLLACGWPNNKGYKWKDTRKLMEYGLEHYHYRKIGGAAEPGSMLAVDVFDPEMPYRTSEKIALHVQDDQKEKRLLLRDEEEIHTEIKTIKYKKAPVKKGEKAGIVSYYLGSEKIAEDMIVTNRAIGKRTWGKCLQIVMAKFLTMESVLCYVKYI